MISTHACNNRAEFSHIYSSLSDSFMRPSFPVASQPYYCGIAKLGLPSSEHVFTCLRWYITTETKLRLPCACISVKPSILLRGEATECILNLFRLLRPFSHIRSNTLRSRGLSSFFLSRSHAMFLSVSLLVTPNCLFSISTHFQRSISLPGRTHLSFLSLSSACVHSLALSVYS